MEREIGLIASGPSRYFSSPLLLFIDTCMCTYVSFSLSHTVEICMRVYIYIRLYSPLSYLYLFCVDVYIYMYFSPTRLLRIQVYMYLSYSFIQNLTYISPSLSLSLFLSCWFVLYIRTSNSTSDGHESVARLRSSSVDRWCIIVPDHYIYILYNTSRFDSPD